MKYLALLLTLLNASAATLSWFANTETNLAGYNVYTGMVSRAYVLAGVTTLTNFPFPSLGPGITYFAVTAFDQEGLESDFSDEVSWTNNVPVPPNAPVIHFLSGQLIWNLVPGAVAYRVDWGPSPGATSGSIQGSSTSYSLVIFPLRSYIRVTALSPNGNSPVSNELYYSPPNKPHPVSIKP